MFDHSKLKSSDIKLPVYNIRQQPDVLHVRSVRLYRARKTYPPPFPPRCSLPFYASSRLPVDNAARASGRVGDELGADPRTFRGRRSPSTAVVVRHGCRVNDVGQQSTSETTVRPCSWRPVRAGPGPALYCLSGGTSRRLDDDRLRPIDGRVWCARSLGHRRFYLRRSTVLCLV